MGKTNRQGTEATGIAAAKLASAGNPERMNGAAGGGQQDEKDDERRVAGIVVMGGELPPASA